MRGNDQAQAASKSALGYSNTLQGQQGSLYGNLAPTLEAESAHPQGMGPTEKAAANTAAQQSAGGSQAAAVGQGSLMAQRTRNAGTADAAIGEASRGVGRNLSDAALKTELADSEMKREQQQHAQSELGSLYGISTGGANQALGEVAPNVSADTAAKHQSWDWSGAILDPILGAASRSKRF